MRIIGGVRRGKKLHTPQNRIIRPTADRVRESIFNILAHRVEAARVLDLFAGTGAMGLEALSRGAEHVLFVDHHPAALALIEKNIRACGWNDESDIVRWDILRNLNCIRTPPNQFDLVFIDPPYRLVSIATILGNLEHSHALKRKALVTVEHSHTEKLATEIGAFTLVDQRVFGKTLVSFFRNMLQAPGESDKYFTMTG